MKLKNVLAMAGLATVLTVGMSSAFAQGGPGGGPGGPGGGFGGRGNFDPAQIRQMMLDRTKQQLDITDDAEWKALEPKVGAVFDARMASMAMGGFGRGGGRPPQNANGDTAAPQRRQNPFGTPSPALEALQKAIDAKAPAAELKTKIEAYRAEVKQKQAVLEKAQEDLKKVLSTQQEAIAVANGLLN